MKNYALTAGILSCLVLSSAAQANTQNIQTEVKPFSVKLAASRLIYNPSSAGTSLAVVNEQDYPMLIQSQVVMENKKDPAPFVVTPPLFRLDGQQQNRLRIVGTDNFAQDKESLYWLCVTGIPPSQDDTWNKDNAKKGRPATLQALVRVKSCIKLMVRPPALKGNPTDVASSLSWQREGKKLKVSNPSPFYINLKTVQIGQSKVKNVGYIAPFASETFTSPTNKSTHIRWTIITDAGGESREYSAQLNNKK